MKRAELDDTGLDELLRTYQVSVASSESAVDDMVRAARVRAVGLRDNLDEFSFIGSVASVLGFRQTAHMMWSTAAGIAVALLLGVSMGASDIFPNTDEQAFVVDFDAVLGTTAISAGQDLSL